ncbi:ketopantoate reductase family protein [Candidatus Enterococcus ferrettii]|uniref:Ketopantoate reductase N-terminal domain-containing protein n=1 Tax=Candidatus Enterococcus ferrettii TaxID=2815324 RepID=A0ABV0EKQ8_9ENTE|nr:2-dehydropantoate 2-reductase N-terminal domain-containing protein [Enterococcus sp. 665A]MBO1340904.1 hypothetical protein [Enterococcus sp. 665A]
MRVLIIGCGVLGSIFGNLFSKKKDNYVVHYMRNEQKAERYNNGFRVSLFNNRKSADSKNLDEMYYPTITNKLEDESFDIVLISVNSHQILSVLSDLEGRFNTALHIMFNNFWGEKEQLEEYLGDKKYLCAFPNAGGGFFYEESDLILKGAIGDSITLGAITETNKKFLEIGAQLFSSVGCKVIVEENMLHWLWAHYALICSLNSAVLAAGDGEKFISDRSNLRRAVLLVKDSIKVCEKRGINVKNYSDLKLFMYPISIITLGMRLQFLTNKVSKIITLQYQAGAEAMAMYKTMIETAEQVGVSVPEFEKILDQEC